MIDRPAIGRLPVPVGPLQGHEGTLGGVDPRFSAHLQGQSGQRRGLRGGAPVLNAARSSYLRTEWTGPHDRRATPGAIRREVI